MTWQRILCPIDIHTPCSEAVKTASQLCLYASADLYILHIIEDFIAPGMAQQLTFLEGKHRLEYQTVRKRMKEILQQHASPSVTSHILIEKGDAAGQIIHEVNKRNIDLIVLSRTKRSGLEELLFPSVADSVLHNAPCPVLLLRKEDTALKKKYHQHTPRNYHSAKQ